VAATSGDVTHFKDARHFASWFGLTPKEYSSGNSRYLGDATLRDGTPYGQLAPRQRHKIERTAFAVAA